MRELRRLLIVLVISMTMYVMLPSVFAEEPITPSETILFLGDSITEAGWYVRAIEAALTSQKTGKSYRIVNRGKSSETVSGLSEANHPGVRPCLFERLAVEIESVKPDWVVACYGMNDAIYHPLDDQRFELYKAGISRLIEEVHSAGSRIILLTPPPYAKAGPEFSEGANAEAREEQLAEANRQAVSEAAKDPNTYSYQTPYAYYDHVLEVYANWLHTLNNRAGVQIVDMRKAILPCIKEAYGEDAIHPNQRGHDLMAAGFLEQWPSIRDVDAFSCPALPTAQPGNAASR